MNKEFSQYSLSGEWRSSPERTIPRVVVTGIGMQEGPQELRRELRGRRRVRIVP